VAISGTVTVTGAVTVTGTVSISGSVTVTGTVSISGSVTVTGAVTISSGTVSISGTVNITGPVTITSGNINVATAGGTNIIIDKLTQSAFTTRRQTIANVPTTHTAYDWATSFRMGKFYPRGCRGFINYVYYYGSSSGGTGTVTLGFAPYPGGPRITTATITLPATAALAYAQPNYFWNYDGCFIYEISSTGTCYGDYDTSEPYDSFTWYNDQWIRVLYVNGAWANGRIAISMGAEGLTVGEIPVSGTLNTIAIPNTVGSISHPAHSAINGGTTYDLLATIYGAGELCGLNAYTQQDAGSTVTDAAQIIGIVVDGTTYEIKASDVISVSRSNVVGSAAPFILTHITAASNIYAWAITKNIPFQKSLRIYARNNAAAGQYMTAEVMFIYTLLK
jgi:hypothetical protein